MIALRRSLTCKVLLHKGFNAFSLFVDIYCLLWISLVSYVSVMSEGERYANETGA